MNNGQVFWEMLREINPDNFIGELPSRKQSDDWRQQNLQFIHTQVASYLDEQRARYKGFTGEDLKRLAADGSSSSTSKARFATSAQAATVANEAVQFLKLILLVVIIDPPQVSIIEKMSTLPHPTPQVMAAFIQEIDAAQFRSGDEYTSDPDYDHNSPEDNGMSSPSQKLDRELALEEHLAKVKAHLERRESEIQDLKAEKGEISGAYIHLQEKYDAVTSLSVEHEDELRRLNSVYHESKQTSVRDLEMKISQQEETIARYEAQITLHQSNEAELERKFRKLREADDRLQNLQDAFDEQKVKLEEQTRKANQADNYKRKLQASHTIEKERDSLRQQLDDARPKLQGFEDIRRENSKLQQENHEIGQTLSRSERDNTELRETKQAYLAEIGRLHRDSKALREVLAQGQERIADLEDAGSSDIHSSPTIVAGGLESELAETSKHEEQMQVACTVLFWTRVLMSDRKYRIFELEKQLRQMTGDASEKDVEFTTLQRQLDRARELSTHQYKQFQETRQEISSLQSSLAEVREGHPIQGSVSPTRRVFDVAHCFESTETFKKMREQLKVEQKRCAELEEKLSAAQRDVDAANNDRTSSFERHCMMADLNIDLLEGDLLDKPKLKVVEEVKKQHSVALMQLQSEHDALRSRHKLLQEQYDRQTEERNQAWQDSHEAVVANAELETNTKAESQNLQEMKDLMQQATVNKSAESTKDWNDLFHRNDDAFAAKIEEGRERVAKAQQVDKQLLSSDVACHTSPLNEQPQTSSSSPSHPKRGSRFGKFFKRSNADKDDDSKSKNKQA